MDNELHPRLDEFVHEATSELRINPPDRFEGLLVFLFIKKK